MSVIVVSNISTLIFKVKDDTLNSMRCDTCGKDVKEVRRVVVDSGYDRVLAKPLYNCEECYRKKEALKAKKADKS